MGFHGCTWGVYHNAGERGIKMHKIGILGGAFRGNLHGNGNRGRIDSKLSWLEDWLLKENTAMNADALDTAIPKTPKKQSTVKRRIFLVDDHPIIQQALADMLNHE